MSEDRKIKIYTDGASRGNPGPASFAFLITDGEGDELARKSGFIGKATNNRAEYRAVIEALEEAKKQGPREVEVYSDSRLVVNQLNGSWKVKSDNIKPLHGEAQGLMENFDRVELTHVPRDNRRTKVVDGMCNRKLDEKV